ncbi:MAG TPA: hypothetical protein VM389_00160 [Phycisphaerae bacterium]|nr:hypothetical protein [Phycisphaerae bacterium]HUU20920.1 hypothetical protein [Phycisphaerae bacterium]
MKRVRQWPFPMMIGLGVGLVLAGMAGCAGDVTSGGPTAQRDTHYHKMARQYRGGEYGKVCLPDLLPYFQARLGRTSASELRQLLGEPRIVSRDDNYYSYALVPVYGYENASDPDFRLEGKHDEVWHYGETGPPHWISDESVNLFFVIKDGVVIAVRELA